MDRFLLHEQLRSIKNEIDLIEAYTLFFREWVIFKAGFNPNQPRIPAGNTDGGQWTSESVNTSENTNISDSIKHLRNNAKRNSTGRCARYIREALQAGGFNIRPPQNDSHGYAKNFGSSLEKINFHSIFTSSKPSAFPHINYTPKLGDIVIIQDTSKSIAGHMAMYDGNQWISDYKQPNFWPGPSYREEKPSYTIYRHAQ